MPDSLPFQIIIGIFVGIAAALSLQSLLRLPDIIWLILSMGIIFVTIVFIYSMVEEKENYSKKIEALRMTNIFLVSFLPLSVNKMILSASQTADQVFTWSVGWVIFHLILLVGFLTWWLCIKKRRREEDFTGSIVVGVIICIVLLIVLACEMQYTFILKMIKLGVSQYG